MLSEARHLIDRAPQLLVYPCLAITLVVLSFNLAGDGLRDLLDPHTETGRGRPRGWGALRRRRSTKAEVFHLEGAPAPSST